MKPHHPTPEAIELTKGEKDKIMNDFLLPTTVLENAIDDELTDLLLAVSHMWQLTGAPTFKVWAERIEQAKRDLIFEGQQLPWKEEGR